MKKLGFEKILQELCLIKKNGIIGFFYIDNIVFAFKKDQCDKFANIIVSLSKTFTIEKKRELKWFLGLYVICDYLKRALWLSQKAYIMNICNDLASNTSTNPLAATPIEILELLAAPDNENIMNESQTMYQQKVGLLLFAAIATQPDIVFAVLRLLQFDQQPEKQNNKAANQVFHYLFQTQDYCICYERDV